MLRVRLLVFTVFVVCFFAQGIAADLHINEFMSGNVEFLENPDLPDDYPDWIELYNSSDVEIYLGGYYLTDNADNPDKWKIPDLLNIPAKGYMVFYADGMPGLGRTHTSFKLSSGGGDLLLVDKDGLTVLDSITYGQQIGDVSRGRFPDGTDTWHYMPSPSNGKTNTEGYAELCEQAAFSHSHGFYTNPFQLTLSSSQAGTKIYYSLDGTSPEDINSSSVKEYTTPITIDGTVVVRTQTLNTDFLTYESLSQSYFFIDDILNQPVNPSGFPRNWAHTGDGDYEMDPEVVNDPAYKDDMDDALLALPTLSLTMDVDEWFGTNGIYLKGELDKRKVSIEMFNVNDTGDFQINGAVMIVGGSSVNRWKSDKLSMRISFDIEYGQGKLHYPVFDNGVDIYNSLTIDAGLNNAWHYGGGVGIKDRNDSLNQRDIAQYTRDNFMAELQNYMGSYGPHGRKVHVYLNGLYWGMHWLHERPDEHFGAAHLGGNSDDYSVLKHYWDEVEHGEVNENGSVDSYEKLLELLETDLYDPAALDRVRKDLDVDDLIKYLILNFTMGNSDWDHKNWYATRNEKSPDGRWRFHSWDAEHVYEGESFFQMGKDDFGSPSYLHNKLMQNREYRLLFMDYAEKLLISQGPLNTVGLREQYTKLVDELYLPVIAESARWGDNRRDTPYTRDIEWEVEYDWVWNQFFVSRPDYVIEKFKDQGIYSDVPCPVFLYKNDTFSTGLINKYDTIDYEKTANTIYITGNLEDPIIEDADGGWKINPDAVKLIKPLRMPYSAIFKARATDGKDWSPLEQIVIILKSDYSGLRVTEINYAPKIGSLPAKEYEFIEYKNTGTTAIDLSFSAISGGINFAFPFGSVIDPGKYFVVASNGDAFKSRYGFDADGVYTKHLNSSGEKISICDVESDTVLSFKYETESPWPEVSDGKGYTIVSTLEDPVGDPSSAEYYTYSCVPNGSPGGPEDNCGSSTGDQFGFGQMLRAYPNPFENSTEIEYMIKEEGYATLIVYDIYGRLIQRLTSEYLVPGKYTSSWVPDESIRGMYIIKLQSNSVNQSLRIIRY